MIISTKKMDVLHDAEIIAVSVNRFNSTGRVDLRLENGTFHTVELHGLKAFRCEDLVLQNVVNRVLQSVEMQISSAECEHWVKWVTSTADASSWLDEKRKKTLLNDLAVGKINLIVFEPSAGATLMAICDRAVLICSSSDLIGQ